MLYAKLPPQSGRPNVLGYTRTDAHGNRVPVPIVMVQIDELADGTAVLEHMTDRGDAIDRVAYPDIENAKQAAADDFGIALVWNKTRP